MSHSILGYLSPDDRKKYQDFIAQTQKTFLEIDDNKSFLKDYVKKLADDMNIDKKALMQAARTAYKNDLETKKEALAAQIEILEAAGLG